MYKLVRTPDRAEGGITAEEKTAMAAHTQLWIKRAMRTEPIDRSKIETTIHDLYKCCGLKPPIVVIVPSPRVMAFAGGFSAGIWWLRKNGYTSAPDAPYVPYAPYADRAVDNVSSAIYEAAYETTYASTHFATYAPTYASTHGAMDAATRAVADDATYEATHAATFTATQEAIDAATTDTRSATPALTPTDLVNFLLRCSKQWYRMYQSGNMWAAWDCYLTAARDILGLRLKSHEKYAAWEQCAIHGGFRIMHGEFCMVSDFPERLLVDEQNRPHCADGPSHRWRDGWSLYHWHGLRIPAFIIESPEQITIEHIRKEENQEIRRVMIERMGWERFCSEASVRVLAKDTLSANFPALPVSDLVQPGERFVTHYRKGEEHAELLEMLEFKDFQERPLRFVRVTDPSTGRQYILRVAHDCLTPYAGIGASFRMTEKEYKTQFYLRQGDVFLRPLRDVNSPSQHS